jgi:hypothetical protein
MPYHCGWGHLQRALGAGDGLCGSYINGGQPGAVDYLDKWAHYPL